MSNQEILNTLALTRISYFSLTGLRMLYDALGSATAVVEHRSDILDVVPDASPRLVNGLLNLDEAMKRAEAELEYCNANGIRPLCISDGDYPHRLRDCPDAPLVVFYKGTANLNARRVINIVGTRHCTVYGQDVIRQFVSGLRKLCPDVLIVSGLAYGVDINAHRNALDNGYPTVGVLAHGLDYLYPASHKDTAVRMITQGGLLTEFFTQTNADKVNFVRRNRIVAGMSDACVLVESASHGGGLITARLSREYHRDVFAFPGRSGDRYSEGCNNLIRDNGAALITCAEDFVKSIMWQDDARIAQCRDKGIERQIFPELSPEGQAVADALAVINDQQINMLAANTGIPVGRLAAPLFELEMKGLIKLMAGGCYHLLS